MDFHPAEPQQIFIDHLRKHKNVLGFIGMGIGKTAACLYRLNELFLNCESRAALIIAPMRVANLTWPMEIKQWDQFSWMRIANLRTDSGRRDFLNGTAHIYLINYEAMNTLVSLVERRKGKVPYDVVIFDESTKAKNPSSKRINLYRRKVPRVDMQISLTGTPMPNTWMDLFAQVRLVDEGKRLGTNFAQFKREFFYGDSHSFAPWKPKQGTTELIEKKISDITLTLKSSEWLQIPDTVFEDVEIHFTPALREQYEKLERDLVIQLREDKVLNVANAAALVTKLLQFTSGHMYDDEKEVHPVHNLKFDALAKIAKHEKKPLLVACIYQHEQARIREQFPQARFFNDAKNETTQRRMLDDWNAGKIPMLVAHPASVGHGLNLQHGSSVLVYVTLTYSRELYEQMIARLARRGQEEITRVYRLMVPGTVDDAVAEALASKAENEARLISALQMLESFRNK
jgi:hypothetical protein